jgi:hypothetical protein
MNREWMEMVEREGAACSFVSLEPNEEGELPCPACGTVAPLVNGACSDCGLQLE